MPSTRPHSQAIPVVLLLYYLAMRIESENEFDRSTA